MLNRWRARRRFRKLARQEAKRLSPLVDEAWTQMEAAFDETVEVLESHSLLAPRCPAYSHGRFILRRRLRGPKEGPRLFWGCRKYPYCEHAADMTEEQMAYFERWRS